MWVPSAKLVTVRLAVPPDTGTVPNAVVPSKKATVPELTVPVMVRNVTVAVRSTDAPGQDGFGELVSTVEVPITVITSLTGGEQVVVDPLSFNVE
jgi:hypothetical protein